MGCSRCGADLAPGASFCRACGEAAPSAQAEAHLPAASGSSWKAPLPDPLGAVLVLGIVLALYGAVGYTLATGMQLDAYIAWVFVVGGAVGGGLALGVLRGVWWARLGACLGAIALGSLFLLSLIGAWTVLRGPLDESTRFSMLMNAIFSAAGVVIAALTLARIISRWRALLSSAR